MVLIMCGEEGSYKGMGGLEDGDVGHSCSYMAFIMSLNVVPQT